MAHIWLTIPLPIYFLCYFFQSFLVSLSFRVLWWPIAYWNNDIKCPEGKTKEKQTSRSVCPQQQQQQQQHLDLLTLCSNYWCGSEWRGRPLHQQKQQWQQLVSVGVDQYEINTQKHWLVKLQFLVQSKVWFNNNRPKSKRRRVYGHNGVEMVLVLPVFLFDRHSGKKYKESSNSRKTIWNNNNRIVFQHFWMNSSEKKSFCVDV